MRHFMLITALIAGLMLSACRQDVQSDEQNSPTPDSLSSEAKPPSGLNKWELTAPEKEEFEALRDKLYKLNSHQYLTVIEAWEKRDPASRGPKPIDVKPVELPTKDERRRLNALEAKYIAYENWREYEKYVPEFLSHDEAEELVTLQKEELEFALEQGEKYRDWLKQDAATRKPWRKKPTAKLREKRLRLSELEDKISLEREERKYKNKLAEDMRNYHITISKSRQRELISLNTQKNELLKSIDHVREEIKNNGTKQGLTFTHSELFNKVSRHLIAQRLKIDQRMDEIYAPLKTTKEAEKIRKYMTYLSQRTGMAFLPGELEEAIALNAEKLRLTEAGERKALQKWVDDEAYEFTPQSINEATDMARINEIGARYREIIAPMVAEVQLLEREKKLEETRRQAK